jgi:hypothetical protein
MLNAITLSAAMTIFLSGIMLGVEVSLC